MNRKKNILESENSDASLLMQKLNEKEIELDGLKRELEIEVALERVRARTMAMKRSEELADAASILFNQLRELGGNLWSTGFVLIDDKNREDECWMSNPEGEIWPPIFIPNTKDTAHKSMYNHWAKGVDYFSMEEGGKILEDHYSYLMSLPKAGQVFHDLIEAGISMPTWQQYHAVYFKHGYLLIITLENYEDSELLIRFAKVFDQTYTRFLDLKKAEEQTRKALIEASLEKVRARSMAMNTSEELIDVATLMYKELRSLGIGKLATCGFVEIDEKNKIQDVWLSRTDSNLLEHSQLPLIGDKIMNDRYKAWKRKDPVFCQKVSGTQLRTHLEFVFPDHRTSKVKQGAIKDMPDPTFFYCGNFTEGYLHVVGTDEFNEMEVSLLSQFTGVFKMTYQRFLDLKNAEAQTREAQIEASLERIRAKAMAMHSSEDISEATTIVFSELEHLGIKTMRCGIGIMDNNWGMEAWTAASTKKKEEVIKIIGQFDMTKHPALRGVYEAWKNQEDYFSYNLLGKDAQKYYEYVNNRDHYLIPESKSILEKHTLNVFNFPEGGLFAFTEEPLAKESISILQRFTSVFTLTYRRYLDLIQAEAQTREAQIEAGLEKVRASTMAMHKSEQLSETAMVMFDQFHQLGQVPDRIGIAVFNEQKKSFDIRMTDQSGLQLSDTYYAPIQEPTTIHKIYKAWKKNKKSMIVELTGQNLKDWIRFVKDDMKLFIDEKNIKKQRIHYAAYYSHGFLLYTSNTFMKPDFVKLLVRFTNVFDQIYTRFLDLQKAETQAREAHIEAALERVRAQAMAMQHSEDLTKSTSVLLDELEALNLSVERCGIGIINPETLFAKVYSTTKTEKGENVILTGQVDLKAHPAWLESVRAWKSQELSLYVLEGDELFDYYKQLGKYGYKLPRKVLQSINKLKKQYYYNAMFSQGGLYVISNNPLGDENLKIIRRFTDVYHLTYTRYEELQNAEIRAHEAVRQASLDRVRGVIASMRSKEDLNRITPLIWKELTALGVAFIRCGVFIMDVENEIIQAYLSAPDGKTLGIFNLPFESELIGELMVDFWEKGKIYKEHWTKTRFMEFMQRLKDTGQLLDTNSYQGAAAPPDKLDLHFIPFKQGMLYVGNTEPLSKDELKLVRSLADAFSIAYARYEDFRELEIAKNQIETTLNELKSTQSQLIHAEKMASLGELTAGIAHEIQNPLNFVNNFSEVSVDLIEELKGERKKAEKEKNESLEQEILDDVIQNLEKINHHGQRASSIVKGMLEHSRTGLKEKQLVDINALADEYLRLAYHGLRAKDKSFNADFSLKKDAKLPDVKVIPQDIGRVLLNLINNAFYAVSNKAKEGLKNFKPQVIVSTQARQTESEKSTVEIGVKDNGNGIPNDVLGKIFQPFFTTKPTGSGTGLGLSLSYDIIKAHGGELKVETEIGVGTGFIIELPIL